MTEKTKLEEDLERVQYRGKRWGAVAFILLILLLLACFYIVKIQKSLLEADRTVSNLQLQVDTMKLKIETLRIDSARCAEAERQLQRGDKQGNEGGMGKGKGGYNEGVTP